MCGAWHRITGIGRWANWSPRFGDKYRIILTRDASKRLEGASEIHIASVRRRIDIVLGEAAALEVFDWRGTPVKVLSRKAAQKRKAS